MIIKIWIFSLDVENKKKIDILEEAFTTIWRTMDLAEVMQPNVHIKDKL